MSTQKNKEEVLMKRLVPGEPLYKQTRIEGEVHDEPRKTPTFTTVIPKKNKVSGSKRRDTRQKSGMQMLVERVDRYDFRKSLARAPARNTFGQIANKDIDDAKKELQKLIAKKTKKTSMNVAGEGDRGPSPSNRHQVVESAVYSEAFYGLLESAAIRSATSDKLARKLRLELSSTERRIIVAYGSSGSCTGSIPGIQVIFGSIVMRADSSTTASVPYDSIIGAPNLAEMRACI